MSPIYHGTNEINEVYYGTTQIYAKTPVMEGLVCWLDARDYNGGSVLLNRITTCPQFNATVYGSPSYTGTSINFTGSQYIQLNTMYWTNTKPTLTMGARMKVSSSQWMIYGQSSAFGNESRLGTWTSGGSFFGAYNAGYSSVPYPTTEFFSSFVSVDNLTSSTTSYIKVYANNNATTFSVTDSISTTNKAFLIAKNTTGNLGAGIFGSLYIYNRVLTDSEIALNNIYENNIIRS